MHVVDYIVIVIIIAICLGIGIVFAVKDFRNTNRIVYLLGGRQMSMVPIGLSIFSTFSSGSTLLGIPTDVYTYGVMAVFWFLGAGIAFVCISATFVPLMHPLRLTSLYEYLQMRFDSTAVRMFAVVVGILQTLCFMAIALLTPALALQTGASLSLGVSIGLVGFIGTVYTTIGGIKSVVWTDAFQSFVMFGGVLTIAIRGTYLVGSGDSVLKIAQDGGRISFNKFSLDPSARHTWWTSIIGGIFLCCAVVCSQSTLQRISAAKSARTAQNACLLTSTLFMMYGAFLSAIALVMYAYFVVTRCDPFQAGIILSRNQLTPYFVLHGMEDSPGVWGIYIATLFSASLSTLSSGVNSLAAITVEDLLKTPLKKVQESTATIITKIFAFVYGILIIGLAFGAHSLGGPVMKLTLSFLGAFGGPIFGILLLGAICPWANSLGAIVGGTIALTFNLCCTIGNEIYGRKAPTLRPPPTDMCFSNRSENSLMNHNVTFSNFVNETLFISFINETSSLNTTLLRKDGVGYFMFNISYEWMSLTGSVITLIIGMVVSFVFRRHFKSVCHEKLLFTFIRKFRKVQNILEEQGLECMLTTREKNVNEKSSL